MENFTHLHCHTNYSLLDGAAKIKDLFNKASRLGMKSLAITDHGNMFGVPHFVNIAQKTFVKPIIGCEFYLSPNMHDHKDRTRYHQVLLAKSDLGYKNLVQLSSLSFIDGFYYKPRIDKELIKKYSKDLIATTCCLSGEVPRAIINKGEKEAERLFLDWLDIFGDDYYIELQRHAIKEEDICNEVLIKWSKKYNVKCIATNDVHYVDQIDSEAQDVLLCLQTGKFYNDKNRMRFPNDHFFLKSYMEMFNLFKDIPDSISNTQYIVDKIDNFSIEKDILLPIYNLPDGFLNQDDYLKKLAFDGALIKYNSIDSSIKERIDYELKIISLTKFPGYFLIVKDFIDAAKKLDVFVGPGRGSVTGSLVAYCIGITNIDPIKYNLIFERFLNPERISMPDIDIDFDDKGRQKIIDYVVEKYGKDRVAQIITFGSMAAKSSIKDVSRVLGLPVEKANYIAKLVPDKPGTTLSQAFSYVPELLEIKKKVSSIECTVLNLAERLEGSIRHTGVHAAGIIISPYNLLDYFPLKTDKDSDLFVTQYDGSLSEKVGMLKMDFLGLKTLTIIKDALFLINKNYDLKININEIDLEDEKTFNLYGIGNTIGTFQFESEGMRHWLPKLKPNSIDDLIAMNALYRPGPMKFIPNFIDRKNGKEEIKYQHPLLEPILSNTYGVMVYQEQIIKIAQIVAGYTLGQADILRKAMSKKKAEEMTRQKAIFIKGSMKKHNILKEKSIEIFNLMEKFSEYGFSLAHSTAYSIVAYHTAYLKANYTAAYMSSVLTNNNNDIDKLSIFINECKKNKIKILNPDVNESNFDFDINNRNEIRFGLCAIKGLGRPTAKSIIDLRDSLGDFLDIFDFVERSNLKLVNKKTLDSLVMSGAFDSFEDFHRREYLFSQKSQKSLIESSLLYGTKFQKEKISNQQSLFLNNNFFFKKPTISSCLPYSLLDKLNIEKETIGFYISNHPLDDFEIELKKFCNCNTLNFLNFKNKDIYIAGIVLDCIIKVSKNGNSFALFTIEDFYGKINLSLFGDLFLKNKIFLKKGELLYISGFLWKKKLKKIDFESENFKKENEWVIKIKNIKLLNDLRLTMIKNLTIEISINKINKIFIEDFKKIIISNPGKCNLKLFVFDDNNFTLKLISLSYYVSPTNNFFKFIRNIGIYKYLIN